MASSDSVVPTRHLATALVVALVVLAGCIGGIGGDSGDGATPTATETTDSSGADETTTDDGETTTDDEEATTDDGETTTEGGETTDDGETTTDDGDSGDADAIASSHVESLREAGGYTVEVGLVQTTSSGDETTSTTRYTTQKVDLETGERYWGLFGFEYYQPPDSETVYVHSDGNTREVPASEARFFELTNVSLITGQGAMGEFLAASERTSGSTELGPATVYVVDSIEDLPESTLESLREDYEEIKSVRYRLYVDEDTGVIAKYDYRIEAVDRDEVTVESGWEIVELGPPEIDRPEWVPDGRLTAPGEDPALVGPRATVGSR